MRALVYFFYLSIVAALIAAWTWLAVSWSYSEGERAGYVQKFSRKGWLCKTWEGEIALVTMPGAIPDRFEFSVLDDNVAAQINALSGQRVVLSYEQHKFIPTNCFGETEYFVNKVVPLNEQPAALAPNIAPPLNTGGKPAATPASVAPTNGTALPQQAVPAGNGPKP